MQSSVPPLNMDFNRANLTDETLLSIYRDLLFSRMIEEKMLLLLRQGKVSKWFSGIGQEAISVGLAHAVNESDYLLPLHRNLGIFISRKVPLSKLIQQWLGKWDGFTQGRDRSFHFGSLKHKIIGMISHLGAMFPVADGLALASNLDAHSYIAVPLIGDGGTSEGDVHEAMNVAAVWNLPVLFIIENNGYGLSTPIHEQYHCTELVDRAQGYGMAGLTVDGNNVLSVYHTIFEIAQQMREDRKPVLLECKTFRMRGHEEASGTKYVPSSLFDEWNKKDPILNFERFLKEEKVISSKVINAIKEELKTEIQYAVEEAFNAQEVEPNRERELADVYKKLSEEEKYQFKINDTKEEIKKEKGQYYDNNNGKEARKIRFIDAIQEGLRMAMDQYENLVIMGQDIAEYGGVFKVTDQFVDKYGKERVRNTPLCESAIIGISLGLSLAGKKSVVEMQFADFVACGFNQIVNNLAKTHYRWGHPADVVIRMPTGGGVGAGPFHSQSMESWFTHVPGLKVVYPASPQDAKNLLITSIIDPNPILYFEHKYLYRKIEGPVPIDYVETSLGKAQVVQEGKELTIVTYGLGVHWALALLDQYPNQALEIIDLRTLIPWDQETVYQSVQKTNKCLVLYEATYTSAFGAEIAASVSEYCFPFLDGPVVRLGSMDTPVPFHPSLEQDFLASSKLEETVRELLAY